jgi:hypothetical protein
MRSPELTLTAVTDDLEFTDVRTEIEMPTLPLKLFTDQLEFDKKVQILREEYELKKPVGNFF